MAFLAISRPHSWAAIETSKNVGFPFFFRGLLARGFELHTHHLGLNFKVSSLSSYICVFIDIYITVHQKNELYWMWFNVWRRSAKYWIQTVSRTIDRKHCNDSDISNRQPKFLAPFANIILYKQSIKASLRKKKKKPLIMNMRYT